MPGRDGRRLSPETLHIMRRKAVEAIQAGELNQTEAAAVFGVSRSTVAAWMKAFRGGGAAALRGGRKGRPTGRTIERGMDGDLARFVMENLPSDPDTGGPLLWTRDRLTAAVQAQCGICPSRWTVQRLLQQWGLTLPPERREALARLRQECTRLLSAATPGTRHGLPAPPFFLLRCLPHPVRAASGRPPLGGHWLAALAPRGTALFCGLPDGRSAGEALPAFRDRLARPGGPGPPLLLPEADSAFRRVMLTWLRRHCRCLPLLQAEQDVVYLLHQINVFSPAPFLYSPPKKTKKSCINPIYSFFCTF